MRWMSSGSHSRSRISNPRPTTLLCACTLRQDSSFRRFLGKQSGSLYFAVIKDEQRIFGIDREDDTWHIHPYGESGQHEPLPQGLEPKPLLKFLAKVEQLIMDHNILTNDSAIL